MFPAARGERRARFAKEKEKKSYSPPLYIRAIKSGARRYVHEVIPVVSQLGKLKRSRFVAIM